MPDVNNVDYFNAIYVEGQSKARIMLDGSEKFGQLKDPKSFTDQEKSDYIDELLERRRLSDQRRLEAFERGERQPYPYTTGGSEHYDIESSRGGGG